MKIDKDTILKDLITTVWVENDLDITIDEIVELSKGCRYIALYLNGWVEHIYRGYKKHTVLKKCINKNYRIFNMFEPYEIIRSKIILIDVKDLKYTIYNISRGVVNV